MERRQYTRHTCAEDLGLHVYVILSGGSLVDEKSSHFVELEGKPTNVSHGGTCITFDFDPDLSSLEPNSEVDLVFCRGDTFQRKHAIVMHVHEGHKKLGLQFLRPLSDLSDIGL